MNLYRPAIFILLSLFSFTGNSESLISERQWLTRSGKFTYKNHPDSALTHITNIKQRARQTNDIETLAEAFYLEAYCQLKEKKHPQALLGYYNAIKLFKRVQKIDRKADCLRSIGLCYLRMYNYKLAQASFLEEKPLRQERIDTLDLSKVYHNLGLSLYHLKELDSSKVYLHKALETGKKVSSPQRMIDIYMNLGTCHLELKEYEKSFRYYNKGLKIAESVGDEYRRAKLLCNIGASHFETHNYDQALKFYKIAITQKEYIDNKHAVIYTYADLGDLFIELGLTDSALIYYRKVTDFDYLQTDPFRLKYVLQQLRDHYESEGNIRIAYKYSKQSARVSDHLDSMHLSQKKQFLAEKGERIHLTYENSILSEKNNEYRYNIKTLSFLIFSAIVVLFLVIWKTIKYYKNSKFLSENLNDLKERSRFLFVIRNHYNLDLHTMLKDINRTCRKKFREELFKR